MNLAEIEKAAAGLDLDQEFALIYELLRAYGLPKASIARVKNGSYDKSDRENEILWKGKVFYRYEPSVEKDALYALIEEARGDERIERFKPRFLIVRNRDRLVARDQLTADTLDIPLSDLAGRADFFLPWAGIEKTQVENANIADVKAAQKMAKLYDEIVKHNAIESEADTYTLNVFFSRLLFCFFAEDTGVFDLGQFTGRIASLTRDSGEDLHEFLDRLFAVLDTEPSQRRNLPGHLADFGYVNGKLFSRDAPSPRFTSRARALLIDCGTLDWAQINPDIFGSMIQAVAHRGQRADLGMHYTSVENIMKVIRPLLLDELEEEFRAAEDSPRRLRKLRDRISKVKIFDPACGSGNFLVISYKELRKLEHRILGRLIDLEPEKAALFTESVIELENFHGIEIDGFAHEIAMLSLWLAKHQMNLDFEELFGVYLSLIPLRDAGVIVNGNATQLDWEEITPKSDDWFVYVIGNPPYLGYNKLSMEQKSDFAAYFDGEKASAKLDYVAIWLFKGAEYVADGRAGAAFVATNSICQGEQVSLIWPRVFALGVKIPFAHRSFLWTNHARGRAGVTCVVVGLSAQSPSVRRIYDGDNVELVGNIGPYLVADAYDTVVYGSRLSKSGLPKMTKGSQPTDGGNLLLSLHEYGRLLDEFPEASTYIRRYTGAEEFLEDRQRYCLWIDDDDAAAASSIPGIAARLSRVTDFRNMSSKQATVNFAAEPWRFTERRHKHSPSIIVPSVSSERRTYIPIGFLDEGTVISNLANAIYDAEPWVFGLIQSRTHMAWVRAVAGRLKTDYRYSAVLVYNTFPVPELTDAQKEQLEDGTFGILEARARYSGRTLAQLYDPDEMPRDLREAHQNLDEIVDRIYRNKPFDSDEERLELLFKMYSEMTSEESIVA